MARYEDLPYRTCVGMMLINAAGLVFIGRRAGGVEHVDESHIWQMPQGGVDPGEDTWAAAKRELYSMRKPASAPSRSSAKSPIG
jgi:putative (di)nucleoside polyphosphate hydrolase